MYTMVQAVHVLVVQLILSPLISLPPKAKLGKVTIPMAILTRQGDHPYGNTHSDTSPLSWVVVGSLFCGYGSLFVASWL